MNLVQGLTEVLMADNASSRKIVKKLSKGLEENPPVATLLGLLIDNLKELEPLVEKSAKQIGWEFSFEHPATLVEYYKLAYNRLSVLIPNIAGKYGYDRFEVEAEVYWIPENFGEVATQDDTIGEWHFSVSYKEVYLFGLVVTPLYEEKTIAIISEDVEESFDASFFGYDANPYIDLNTYDELVKFLNTYFEYADIKGTHSNEIDRRTNKVMHLWVGPRTPEAKDIVQKYVKPELEKNGFTSYTDSYGETNFVVRDIDSNKAKQIVDDMKEKYGHVHWSFTDPDFYRTGDGGIEERFGELMLANSKAKDVEAEPYYFYGHDHKDWLLTINVENEFVCLEWFHFGLNQKQVFGYDTNMFGGEPLSSLQDKLPNMSKKELFNTIHTICEDYHKNTGEEFPIESLSHPEKTL